MGEAKRRKSAVYDVREIPLSADGDAQTLVGSVLANMARVFDAAIFLKQRDDGLLKWPLGAIVGQTVRLDKVRACPLDFDIRAIPTGGWEFLIPDHLLLSGYCIDLMKRGLAFPGPVPPDDFLGLVREFFTNNPCKWVSVIPDAWTSRQGEAVH